MAPRKNSYENRISNSTPTMAMKAEARHDAPAAAMPAATNAKTIETIAKASMVDEAMTDTAPERRVFSITRSMGYNDIRER